ncbi:MAG: FAD-dependent oxidoreductase [Azospirillaceae bacterium]
MTAAPQPGPDSAAAPSVLVLGAGMVGISCALSLQARGWRVTVLDRRGPGEETSYGNSGVISRSSIVPPNNPGIWKHLRRYLGNRHAAVRYSLPHLIRHRRWTAGFLKNATRARTAATATALNDLVAGSVELHTGRMAAAGISGRLRHTGWLRVFRGEGGLAGTAYEREFYDRFAIAYTLFDRAGLKELEPHLAPLYAGGILFTDTASVDNPGAVTKAYAALFEAGGGSLRQAPVKALDPDGRGGAAVVLEGGERLAAEHVVVALGPWSADLLSPLGVRIPQAFERGYHRMFQTRGNAVLGRPVHDADGAFVLSPQEAGIRLTTGIELAHRDARPNLAQIEAVLPRAREAFPLGAAVTPEGRPETWHGSRPSMPDGRPAIGPLPGHQRLWAAFGHGHIGFSTGPRTGELLARLMTGEDTGIDMAPFDPGRF